MEVSTLKKMIDDLSLCEDVMVEKTDLIIDGKALYYSLYFTSDPKLDQCCGGDYPGFKHEVCKFFKTLQDCEVNPYVIVGGGSGPEKHEKNLSSLKYKLKNAKKIPETEPDGTLPEGYNVLPPLVKDVFIEMLREKRIEFKVCLGEGDPEVVSEANQKQCAVLSIYKHYYIFDVHKGFLNLHNFEWKKEDGKIPAKIYTRSKFCEHFKLDPALMPVFASIAGDDYSRLEDNATFANESSSPGMNSIKRLDGMLRFLSKVNLDGLDDSQKRECALSEALNHVGKKENQTFKFAIKKYVNPEKTSSKLPSWVCKKVERGELTSFTTSVVDQKTILLTPLVEDFSQRSSYTAAYRIRQYFYGLLTGGEMCTEYGRDGEKIKDKRVPSILPSSDEQKQLKLKRLHKAPEGLRRKVFEEALQVQTSELENIPDQLKLPVCVTVFWFKRPQHQRKPETVNCLHALLLWFVCELDGPEDEFERKMKALKDEVVHYWQPHVAHAFSQWQCCMRQSLHLNQLLCSPLPEPQCARLYCGPLLHRLADEDMIKQLQKTLHGQKKELYKNLIQQLLGRGPQVRKNANNCRRMPTTATATYEDENSDEDLIINLDNLHIV